MTTQDETGSMTTREKIRRGGVAVAMLYVFLVGVGMLEDGIAQMGEGFSETVLASVSHPLAGLFAGILATILIQSSSASTAMIVGLVAAGTLPVEVAVPMVMGANIGTTVTNTLVSMTAITRVDEFRRVVAAATVHDIFNFFAVAILLPLELMTGWLSASAYWLGDRLAAIGIGGADVDSPIGMVLDPANDALAAVLGSVLPDGAWLGSAMLVGGLVLLFVGIRQLSRTMKAVVSGPLRERVDATVGKAGGLAGIGVGTVAAVLVMSSTIVTVTLLPLVAAGALAVRNAYPVTVGANLGTTLTAFLAALATGSPEALVIALVHMLFNVTAVLLIYPVPQVRRIPLRGAELLAELAARRKWVMPAYAGSIFGVLPLAVVVLG